MDKQLSDALARRTPFSKMITMEEAKTYPAQRTKTIDTQRCPECGEGDFFVHKEKGEAICKNCSFVIDDSLIDFGYESRIFGDNDLEANSRSGAPFDPRVANNLITHVGNDSDMAQLPDRMRAVMRRIRRKNSWTSSSLENNLNVALANLRVISSYVRMPETAEKEAARIYRMCAERGLTKARSSDGLIVASLYIACRMFGLPKTIKELSDASKIDKKVIGKYYKFLLEKLAIKITLNSPHDYVERFGSTLNLSPRTLSKAVELLEKAEKAQITSGRSPVSLAATALYLSAIMNGERRTQNEVTTTTQITEVTLRNRCQEFISTLKMRISLKR